MQYTRLITSLIEECIAASLGGYDVEDVLAGKSQGGDLIREILVRAVCDPRFKGTIRVARAWQDDAHDLLESFAQELMDIRGLTREEALERMDRFLDSYFFTMVQRVSSRDLGSDILHTGGVRLPDGAGTDEGAEKGESGDEGDDEDGRKSEVGKSRELKNSLREFGSGPQESHPSSGAEGSGGNGCSREEEQQAELRYLRNIPASLRKLAALIGRSGSEEQTHSGRFPSGSKSDIAGITVGNDLSSVLPSEIALLGHPATEDIFLKNYAARRLQVFASASSGGEPPVHRQDGPVIICLDRSGSMEGRPSDIARAITVAVTILAKREHREVVVAVYGDTGSRKVFNVKNLRIQRQDFVRFLSYRCSGGNDEDSLFRWLFTEILPADKPFDNGDVLCVSDFGWAPVGPEVMELIRASKAKGMKFYGLDISGEGISDFEVPDFMAADGSYPPEIIDAMWIWDERKNLCYEEGKQDGKIRK